MTSRASVVAIDATLGALQEEASYNDFIHALRMTGPSSMSSLPALTGDGDDEVVGLKRLIVEKEKDLELAARIGQSLLTKNRLLQVNHDELAQLCTTTQDELTQLRHELSMNKEILRIYALESPDYGANDVESDPTAATLKHVQLLQSRIRFLEDENNRLRQEARELSVEAADFETKETEVLHEVTRELAETHDKIQSLTENLKQKTDENSGLQGEIELVLTEMVALQEQLRKAARENDEIKESLEAYKENQSQLACELIKLQAKYTQLNSHAHALEGELREIRRTDHYVQSWAEVTSSFAHVDSLQAELDQSLFHVFNSVESAEDDHQEDQYRRVMDVVRLVNLEQSRAQTTSVSVNPSSGCIMSSAASSSRSSARRPPGSSMAAPEIPDLSSLGSYFGNGDGPRVSAESSPRNSTLPDDGICDRTFLGSLSSYDNRSVTPDSAMSLGAASDTSGHPRPGYTDLSTKLQLVKPFEGSRTLHTWKDLGISHMTAFLDARPGILTRGQNAVADRIASEEVAARKENRDWVSLSSDIPVTVMTSAPPKFTRATASSKTLSLDQRSIFSVGTLPRYGLPSSLAFPHPSAEVQPNPGVNVNRLISDPATAGLGQPICDPLIDLPPPDDANESDRPRSRHTSGSLTSASRSPSPIKPPVPSSPSLHRKSAALFQSPFQKLNQKSPLLSPVQRSLEVMGKKSSIPVVRDSRRPVKKPV